MKKSSLKTIRPIAAYSLHGLASWQNCLLAVDSITGYLLKIDPVTDNTAILNTLHWRDFVGSTGIAIADDQIWFTSRDGIYVSSLSEGEWTPQLLIQLEDPPDGVAVWGSTIYVTSQKSGKILVFNRETGKPITHFYAPGIGVENITVRDEQLWVSDNLEQSVYCLDRATGKIIYSILTPFQLPTGLSFYGETLYVAYAFQEPYIRDNPNRETNYELQYRDRTFIHPLHFQYYPEKKYTLSNGYRLEITYVEEISPLDQLNLQNLEWRIALPAQTNRQKIIKIEAIGLPFTEEEKEDGQKVAVFKFDRLTGDTRCIFGWRAILEVWSIKYQLTPKDCESLPPLSEEYKTRYLVDDDDLAMGTEIISRAAQEAVKSETNLLRKVYNIRNYVYDHLSYGIKPHIDTPDIALKRGVGSCGEYLGLLLALSRLNGIPCRTVGRYKCPPYPDQKDIPLSPDYNHVWMEFYLPGFGWLPMESNPDDLFEGGPYPNRFFMGIAWYHAEMAKGVPFEQVTTQGVALKELNISIGELALNHVQFVILDDVIPE
ncbi:transglutaminase domain-containing protein [Gloeocapsa sp. PCC 73106]|uniref:transglutaminase domain-containing protein n=1 Tax=Gloeocapsa sp. PCC 73106 TaxID=102232 RepID=UPI0002ABE90E|nr:transglutaminase domain-containing protein [Gloeocapsa sp. PCC 73106]ELR98364.1 transglutaminase-like enzyme, predicted cysteine protease [Gloeocapsa sp. PCC 73106]